MTLKERYSECLAWFRDNMPAASSELKFMDPFQLIVAVILSAQCTDQRVNMVTPALFEAYPTSKAFPTPTARPATSSKWRRCFSRVSGAKSQPV